MKNTYIAVACIAMLVLGVQMATAQSNIQQFTPSVLLQKKQVEYNLFNSLYTQKKVRDRNGNSFDLGERQSFFRNTFSVLYGVSESRRVNLGFQANIVTARYISSNNSTFDFKKTVLSSVGPVIKFTPFKNIGFLSVQSTLLFPVSDELESTRFIDHDRITWATQIFFDKALTEDWRVFLETGLLYRFKKLDTHENFFRVPFSAILSYFPSSKSTIFTSLQYSPAFGDLVGETTSKFGKLRWFTAVGLGAKYQVTSTVGLELSYTNFILSREDGAGSTLNFGIRIIK